MLGGIAVANLNNSSPGLGSLQGLEKLKVSRGGEGAAARLKGLHPPLSADSARAPALRRSLSASWGSWA